MFFVALWCVTFLLPHADISQGIASTGKVKNTAVEVENRPVMLLPATAQKEFWILVET